ncbi:aminodeoxychorismate synthase [Ophiostoma piceae UAMH 11346]|uniref:aminodeoxychorismate synthase n=1 Tax=Ophiostoma piceae (strain UAMH 11346) TaxID=1262450 RepID=S3D1Q2_OPHP1|nr:aminodeoxychorismate synthase [Ophiostoma piceae UAMH 11346]
MALSNDSGGSGEHHRPRILFLDAYDSFANNITALLATLLDADVHVLPIDAAIKADAFRAEVACYDAVVCGPGPGSPDCAADIGLMQHVWAADPTAVAPTLGICLGFQSLVTAHGGRIRRLRSGGLHGMVRAVDAQQQDIFQGVQPFRATLYHSLGADVGQDRIPDIEWGAAKWQSLTGTRLQPLAWVEEPLTAGENERILMGVRHETLPFWGLQYHPESVCTDAVSHAVLVNWFRAAVTWNTKHGRVRTEPDLNEGGLLARQATRPSLLSLQPSVLQKANKSNGANGTDETNGHSTQNGHGSASRHIAQTIPVPLHVEVPDIVEILQCGPSEGDEPEHIILDSASAAASSSSPDLSSQVGDESDNDAIRGRYSIIALDVSSATRIEYRTGDRFATVCQKQGVKTETETIALAATQSIWQLLAEFHESKRAEIHVETVENLDRPPFLGGFMGYITYEQGLDDIGVAFPSGKARRSHGRPDICWAWVTRSIVVDHQLGIAHIQSISGNDAAWVDSTACRLVDSPAWKQKEPRKEPLLPLVVATQFPDEQRYEDLVRQCQEYIAAGESYELCLTGETRITTTTAASAGKSSSSAAWALYRALRKKNPSPFASYLRLGAATLVSSSPERFLCFSPSKETDGKSQSGESCSLTCSMRPMKGTVRRSSTVRTLADAEALLHIPKEEAENLMIVDLVRHDLHAICGPGGVHVPRLLQVEPYGHVFQMVSVVEGSCPSSQSTQSTGIDVLSVSLPPGSMTGAPKKRSCALLTGMEEAKSRPERSLYSGVVGYICVTGRGDWSVTIRSLFSWDDETTVSESGTESSVWHIGAGGAVTILSTPEGEREEMFTKLAGPLGVFNL